MHEKKRQINSRPSFFRQFSRRKYAAFNSMHRVVHISRLVAAYTLIILPCSTFAQNDTSRISMKADLEEIEIAGFASPVISTDLPRLVSTLVREEADCAPVHSITDLLRYSGNIDLRQRGKSGIQSDVSFRGGSFDHSLVLINGIILNDPQTGHLSMNIPFETQAVHKIELLNGSSARIHGANAFTGAVNFITKPSETNSIRLTSSFGQFGFLGNSATLNLGTRNFRNLLHYNMARSAGYMLNTDYFRQGFFYHGDLNADPGRFIFQLGYNDRSFGANGFYTPRFPDQFERNSLWFASVGYETRGRRMTFHPEVYGRQHRDRWEMFRVDEDWYRIEGNQSITNNPAFTRYDTTFIYTNHHLTHTLGARLKTRYASRWGMTSAGIHFRTDRIMSTSIGYELEDPVPVRGFDGIFYTYRDSRSNMDLHLEQTLSFWRFYLSGGTLINWNSYLPDEIHFFPGLDLQLKLFSSLALTGSYNYSLGLPTFTDLTYRDPDNEGDINLEPYSKHAFEGGIKWHHKHFHLISQVFMAYGRDVIDWLWFEDQKKFRPVNVEIYGSRGIELSGRYTGVGRTGQQFSIRSLQFAYTFLDMEKEVPGDILKYQNIRHKANLLVIVGLPAGLHAALTMNYTDREGSYLGYDFENETYRSHAYEPYFLMDIRLGYEWRSFTLFAEVSNMLNTRYIDAGSIYQPGRWFSGGIKCNFEASGN